MGLDIHARMIIGYKVSFKKQKFEVTKFDPDTGKPYQKIVQEIKCDDGECPSDLEDFTFGYPEKNDEYEAVRGISLYYTRSHRSVKNQIELFEQVDLLVVGKLLNDFKNGYPDKKVGVYFYPDANW